MSEDQVENLIEKSLSEKIDTKKRELIEKVEKEALIKQNIHLDPQIQKSMRSKESHIDHRDLERFLRLALEKWGTGAIKEKGDLFSIKVPLEFVDEPVVLPRYDKVTFDRETAKNLGRGKVNYVAIGHPFLDRLIQSIQKPDWGGNISVKTDPEGRKGLILNYLTQSKDYGQTIVCEQLQTYWYNLTLGQRFNVSSSFHWEFESHNGQLDDLEKEDIREVIDNLEDIESEVAQIAVQDAINFTKDLNERRKNEVEIKESDAERFFNHKIKRLEERLSSQKAQAEYRDMKLAIRNTESELEKTRWEYKTRKERLAKEKNLAFHTPELQSMCIIIPKEGKTLTAGDAKLKKKVDEAGMEAVMRYERNNNREPEDVSLEFLGYDIRSNSEEGIRYIEVKSFKDTGTVEMTENEWSTAIKLKDDYWLYIVENALDPNNLKITTLRNPTKRFQDVKLVHKETRYLIEDWKKQIEYI